MYYYNNSNKENSDIDVTQLLMQKESPRTKASGDDIPVLIDIERPESIEQDKPLLRELSPALALPRIMAYLDVGSPVKLLVTGNSMQPFLSDRRDSVILVPVKRRLKVGDVIFYLRDKDTPVLHRIVQVQSSQVFICCGDAQNFFEKVTREQVIALVSDVEHRGLYTSCSSFIWRFKSWLWMRLLPIRPQLLRFALRVKRRLHI